MNVGRVLSRLAARAAAVGLAAGYVGLAVAADQPVVVAPAAPAVVAAPEICPTCTGGDGGAPCGKAGCARCGHHLLGHRAGCNGCNPKKPVVGELRPGACFGYFQTQWHRWENVCPLPYQGVNLTDTPQGLPLPGSTGITAPPAPGIKAVPVPKSDAPMPLPMNATPPAKGTTTPAIPAPPAKTPGGAAPTIPTPPAKSGAGIYQLPSAAQTSLPPNKFGN